MVVTLIGYRGSGKSTLAAPLAARLGWDWVDADTVIEDSAGCTIRDIFAAEGEAGFRTRERSAIVGLVSRDRLVLAAGGGAILNPDTRRDLRAAGPVVWLQAGLETLAARIAGDPTTAGRRPSLLGGGLAGGGPQEIARLLAEREPLYRECATLIVDTADRNIDEIVDEICRGLPH
ncbi:MAG: shikimate kinase [Planctomycetaceae bacterium]|nr:shikimate kinase [Planctomycetaceae bacterium]